MDMDHAPALRAQPHIQRLCRRYVVGGQAAWRLGLGLGGGLGLGLELLSLTRTLTRYVVGGQAASGAAGAARDHDLRLLHLSLDRRHRGADRGAVRHPATRCAA